MTWLSKYRWLLVILVLAAGVRVVIGVDRDRWPLTQTEADWEQQGLVYATHGLGVEDLTAYRSPLYPLMIGAVYGAFGADTLTLRLLQVLLSVLTILVVYGMARRLSDSRAPILSAVLASVYPFWISVNASIVSETLLVFLTAATCLMAVRTVERPSLRRGLALGAGLGAGALCAPVALLWAPVLLSVVFGYLPRTPLRVRWNRLAAVACGFLLILGSWTIRNEVVTGYRLILPTNTGMRLLIGHEPRAEGVRQARRDYEAFYERVSGGPAGAGGRDAVRKETVVMGVVMDWIADAPLRTLQVSARKVYRLWDSVLPDAPPDTRSLHFVAGLTLTLFGVWGLWSCRKRPIAAIVFTVVGVWTLAAVIFYASPDLRLPVDLCLAPFAASAMLSAYDRVREAVSSRMRELDAA